ncbi:sialate O-acetylesterase [Pedobacter cryophilus]|uniref:Sialate O-acetylesterase n=1 Tax=Pedobacter cryophilus TaxID=2571271 RepID=A0A4U1C000_9SPHI|nr:sialate O-acetylesterase [Pedobacter cryophilus]TKB96230.1 sialate O-acetylesterase [Pedobacter cryophilus]
MNQFIKKCFLIIFTGYSCAYADVKLASPFSDHMVLQREIVVPVWGTADAGEKVTVKLGAQTKTTITKANGKWMVKLNKLKAGGPFVMTVTGKNKLSIDDVYAGEVWVCSGQSNMDFTVAQEDRYWCGVYNEKEEVAQANYPLIRVFDTDFAPNNQAQDFVKGNWEVVSPQSIGHLSAVAYFFAREIQKKIKVPIGLITTAYGASTAEAWIRKESLEKNAIFKGLLNSFDDKLIKFKADTGAKTTYNTALEKWKIAAAKAKADGKDAPRGPKNPDPVMDQHNPYVLWNGMVKPLVPYAIRGALWYQGESNSPTASIYKNLMETLIKDWRTQWGQGDFPFYYVQLANIGKEIEFVPAKGGTEAIKREAQLQNLLLPHTAMAVAIDNANPENMGDVHPKNKQDIGYRLALPALNNIYKVKTPYSGPIYQKMQVFGNTIKIYFKHVEGGLIIKGDELKGFAIAGEDKKFVWAKATIVGNEILITSPEVLNPKAIRYGWGANPIISLYNSANLPASPFRTDNWK